MSLRATVRRSMADAGKWTTAEVSRGLKTLFGSRAGSSFGILMYHRVARNYPGLPKPTWNATPDRFRQQIKGLVDRGFEIWPLRKAIEQSQCGGVMPARMAVITFDDGYENVYRYAWPVLKEFGVPASVFVATAYVGNDGPFPFDQWSTSYADSAPAEAWKPLSWEQCREMEASGLVEIGSHTHTHQDFRERSEDFRRDLLESLAVLREKLGPREYTFSFPYGGRRQGFSGQRLVTAAQESGVICGLTTEIDLVEPGSSPFEWGRFEAHQSDNGGTLEAKLEGWYSWTAKAREAFRVLVPPTVRGVR